MYQEHFGFNRRPFAAVPDVGLFVENDANRSCLDAAIVCLESGQGIAILTAPAGVGKTILCHKLTDCLKNPFVTILLPNSNFASQRAMLQSVLFELGRKYVRLEEQELRLELITALRSFDARDEKVVLIIDEAEHLKPEILEEIRNLANLSENGRPLLRVILSGQPLLEERLLEPDMTALNQRIRSQLYLQPLTRTESMNYVADQIQICGQIAELVIQENALDLIVHAADGNPRCLNQLSDHSLLLAYMSGERPVSLKTVREALDDLKQLPLQWNDPGTLATGSEPTEDPCVVESPAATEIGSDRDFDVVNDADDDVVSFEVGGDAVSNPVFEEEDDSDDDEVNDVCDSNEERVSVDAATYEETDDETAVFEVGAGDERHEDDSPNMTVPDAANSKAMDQDTDEDDVIELPTDEGSYVGYEQCDPIGQEVSEAQGIASAFLDSDEFTDSYQLESPSLTDDDDAVLDIPLVPLGHSTFQSSDFSPDDGPVLSLIDDLAEDELLKEAETEQDRAIDDLESFAEQAVGSESDEMTEQIPNTQAMDDEPHEEVVFDRYAWLDAGGNPTDAGDHVVVATAEVETVKEDGEVASDAEAETAASDIDRLDTQEDLDTEPGPPEEYDVIMADPPIDDLEPSIAAETGEIELGAELLDEEREMLGLSVDDDVYDVVHPPDHVPGDSTIGYSEDIVTTVALPAVADTRRDEHEMSVDEAACQVMTDDESDDGDSDDDEQNGDRTYANLFSRLRRLQLAAREMDDRF